MSKRDLLTQPLANISDDVNLMKRVHIRYGFPNMCVKGMRGGFCGGCDSHLSYRVVTRLSYPSQARWRILSRRFIQPPTLTPLGASDGASSRVVAITSADGPLRPTLFSATTRKEYRLAGSKPSTTVFKSETENSSAFPDGPRWKGRF